MAAFLIGERNPKTGLRKAFNAKPNGIGKNLRTLTAFVVHWGYRRAILLVYGGGAERCLTAIQKISNRIDPIAPIEVWHYAHAGTGAVCLGMVGEPRAAGQGTGLRPMLLEQAGGAVILRPWARAAGQGLAPEGG